MPVINARGLVIIGSDIASLRSASARLSKPLVLHEGLDFARNVIARFRIDGLMVAKGDAPAHYARSMLQAADNAMLEQLHGGIQHHNSRRDSKRFHTGL